MTTTPEKDRCPGCPGPAIGGCGAAGGSCVAADWLRLGGEAELTRQDPTRPRPGNGSNRPGRGLVFRCRAQSARPGQGCRIRNSTNGGADGEILVTLHREALLFSGIPAGAAAIAGFFAL